MGLLTQTLCLKMRGVDGSGRNWLFSPDILLVLVVVLVLDLLSGNDYEHEDDDEDEVWLRLRRLEGPGFDTALAEQHPR
jgi:hypothetical protein